MKYTGNLIIETQAQADKCAGLTEVTGDLSINSSAKLDALTSVGGYLSIYSSAKLDAPALTSVGGDLSIYSSAKLDALTSVGGYLSINSSAKLDALTSVGGDLYINSSAKLDAPALYPLGFDTFKVYDGIPCAVISSKTKDGVEILACRRAKIKDCNLVGDRFFVAKQGGETAHATTIKEALEELAFKTGARDVEQYRAMPPNTRKSPHQWALIYRQITGACKFGTDDFIRRQGALKKSYTLAEIITITNGAYGSETFKSVVSA
ncbi:MAG: hypothetical protein JNK21_10850 [Rhodospirillaceae bacterium]|nr:hypothetical protein [Rhodospirillaceae bacterium]